MVIAAYGQIPHGTAARLWHGWFIWSIWIV